MTFQERIWKAKQYRIETLYTDDLRPAGRILKGKCPFHEDKENPNFAIYPETNSWYCFRCGTGGDVLTFYMGINKCDFKTAIKDLTKKG